jgi:hypothetical protein
MSQRKTTVTAGIHVAEGEEFKVRVGAGDHRPPYVVITVGWDVDVFLENVDLKNLHKAIGEYLNGLDLPEEGSSDETQD